LLLLLLLLLLLELELAGAAAAAAEDASVLGALADVAALGGDWARDASCGGRAAPEAV